MTVKRPYPALIRAHKTSAAPGARTDLSAHKHLQPVLFVLLIVVLSPFTAWGQVTTAARPDIRGNHDQFAEVANAAPGMFDGAQPGPGSVQGQQPVSPNGVIPQPDGSQPMTIAPQLVQPGIPPELMQKARQRFQSPLWQTSSRGGYFGIMGAVGRPGVYYQKSERVTLNEVVKLAGGPTDDAGGGVRIVRQGHGGLQTFLSPTSQYELLDGDVVLLESNHQPGLAGLRQHSAKLHTVSDSRESPGEATAKSGTKPSAYLAFVNLKTEPIIVPVPSEQATIANVMMWLRQDVKSPPAVRVIGPSPQLRRDGRVPPEQQTLESGTVLVFDPATVKRERLPEFPPVIGESSKQPGEATRTPAANATEVTPRPGPAARPALPAFDSPAGRATRPQPVQVPPPPAEPSQRPVPRRSLGQQVESNGDNSRSALDGPMLMSPQRPRDRDTQSSDSDIKSRSTIAPANLDEEGQIEQTSGEPQPRRLSWQSRPAKKVSRLASHEVDETDEQGTEQGQGILQAHAEQQLGDVEELAGPVLELPRPVPNFEADVAEVIPEPEPVEVMASTPSGFVSGKMVWFSVGSMVVLAAILWCLLRWERVRPAYARVFANRTLSTANSDQVNRKGRSVFMAERQQIFRTDVTPPQGDSQPSSPAGAADAALPALPPPISTISQREHALRAHFRQARNERGQRQPIPAIANEVESEAAVIEQPRSVMPHPAEPIKPPVSSRGTLSDALSRALNMQRRSGPSDTR